jgi:hypothetical protein
LPVFHRDLAKKVACSHPITAFHRAIHHKTFNLRLNNDRAFVLGAASNGEYPGLLGGVDCSDPDTGGWSLFE